MTNNDFPPEDDEIIDETEGGDGLTAGKQSLRALWDGSPVLKIAAVVAGLALFGTAYALFAGGEDQSKSIVRVDDTSQVKQIPGQSELDPAYKAALEETNAKAAEQAASTGGSAIPTPINTPKAGLDVDMPQKPAEDPLSEWRKMTEARRLNATGTAADDDASGTPPDAVPMAQPIRPQAPILRQDPDAANALAEQMRVIVAAQAPTASQLKTATTEESPYVLQKRQALEMKNASAAASAAAGDGAGEAEKKVITTAGTIAYAQMLTEANSDVSGPALVQIMSGPFAGGRALGKIGVNEGFTQYIVLTFNRIIKDGVSYRINGIALDEKTTLAGQATDIDQHYFQRFVLPAAAAFIEGYGSALAEAGSTQTTTGLITITTQPKPSPKESLYRGLQEGTSTISDALSEGADRPPTIKIAKGTTMGILFLDPVTTESIEK